MVSPRSVRIGSVLGVLAGLGAAACAGIIGIDDRQLDPLLGPDGSILPEAGRDGPSSNDGPTNGDSPNPPPPDGGEGGVACTASMPCVLAQGLNHPFELAIDANNVYWTNYGTMKGTSDGSVNSCSVNGCNGTPNVLASGLSNPAMIVVDGQNVYWTELGSGNVVSCPLAGCGGSPKILASGESAPEGIAIDSMYVYWTNVLDSTVHRVPKAGGSDTVLVPAMGGLNQPRFLAVDSTSIYIGDDFNGVLKAPIGGGNATVMDGNANCSCYIGLDSTSVYWTTANGGLIVKASKTTTDGGVALASAQNFPAELRVDTSSSNVYWVNFGSGTVADGTVAKVPTGGGNPTSLATTQDPVEAVVVDNANAYWITFGTASNPVAPSSGNLYKRPK